MRAVRGISPPVAASDAGETRAVLDDALSVYHMDPGLALHRAAEALLLRHLALRGPVLDLGCHDGGFSWLEAASNSEDLSLVGSMTEPLKRTSQKPASRTRHLLESWA